VYVYRKEIKNSVRVLCDLYNDTHKNPVTISVLEKKLNDSISLSSSNESYPVYILKNNELKSFCIVHLSTGENINKIGNAYFSNIISANEPEALKFMFENIRREIRENNRYGDIPISIYGPIHNSILIERGLRTFYDKLYTYQMPDNDCMICDSLESSGCYKAKDLIEIIYDYNVKDRLLTILDSRLEKRLSSFEFRFADKNEIIKYKKEIASLYKETWKDNWGSSTISEDEICIAANNIPNIMGMFAFKNNLIVGFTMMQYISSNNEETIGRAFLSGVKSKFQNTGLSIALTSKLSSMAIELGIRKFSISWMLEDNVKILKTMRKFIMNGNNKTRKYRVFVSTDNNE
jgi:hypothetical protein